MFVIIISLGNMRIYIYIYSSFAWSCLRSILFSRWNSVSYSIFQPVLWSVNIRSKYLWCICPFICHVLFLCLGLVCLLVWWTSTMSEKTQFAHENNVVWMLLRRQKPLKQCSYNVVLTSCARLGKMFLDRLWFFGIPQGSSVKVVV